MDFYAIAWLSGFAFLGICLLILATAVDHLADAIRHDHQEQP